MIGARPNNYGTAKVHKMYRNIRSRNTDSRMAHRETRAFRLRSYVTQDDISIPTSITSNLRASMHRSHLPKNELKMEKTPTYRKATEFPERLKAPRVSAHPASHYCIPVDCQKEPPCGPLFVASRLGVLLSLPLVAFPSRSANSLTVREVQPVWWPSSLCRRVYRARLEVCLMIARGRGAEEMAG